MCGEGAAIALLDAGIRQGSHERVERPDVEPALDPLAVGIERRCEPAVVGPQLGEHEVEGRARDPGVSVVAGGPERLQVGVGEERVVVQHLLEVRNQPLGIGAVARESAAELVVDPAVGHGVERAGHHPQRALVAGAVPRAQQELELHGRGEFRGAAEAAAGIVEARSDPRDRCLELPHLGVAVAGRHRQLRLEMPRQLAGLALDVVAARPIGIRHRLEHAGEARHPMAILGRKVRPAEEWFQLGGQEDAHRPAPGAGHGLNGGHVDVVEVGALFAVHLDRHEMLVHERGNVRVLERLALHDVAPVAGRVADREEDRPILVARPFERLSPPGIPVDRVVGVLEEVRARLSGEAVGHEGQCGMRTGRDRVCAGHFGTALGLRPVTIHTPRALCVSESRDRSSSASFAHWV